MTGQPFSPNELVGFASHGRPKRQAPVPPSAAYGNLAVKKEPKRRAPEPPKYNVSKPCSIPKVPKRPAPSPPASLSSTSDPGEGPRNSPCSPLANRPLPPLPPSSPTSASPRRLAPQPPRDQEVRRRPPPQPLNGHQVRESHSCPSRRLRKSHPPPSPPLDASRSSRHATLPASLPSRTHARSTGDVADPRSLLLSDIANFNGILREVSAESPKVRPTSSGPPCIQDIMREAINKRRQVFGNSDDEASEVDSENSEDKWTD